MNTDAFSVRAVIVILGAVVVAAVGTCCWLALFGHEIPPLLLALGSTTLALLVPSPLSKAKNDEPVEVTTAPGDVVATAEATAGTNPNVTVK